MQRLLFATTNASKLNQFQFVTDYYNYPFVLVSAYREFPILHAYSEEYGTQQEIVQQGAMEIYNQIHRPIVVEDTIFEVIALGNKPGLLASEYLKIHGRAGLLSEMEDKTNRAATITSMIAHYDGKTLKMFTTTVHGVIADKETYREGEPDWVAPTKSNPFGGGFSAVFIPNGNTRSLADMSKEEVLQFGYRDPNFKHILEYLSSSATEAAI